MFTVRSTLVSRGGQSGGDEFEGVVEGAPCGGQPASLLDVVGQGGVEHGQAGGEDAAVGLGEQHRDLPADGGELVAVVVGYSDDQPFALQPAQVVGGLAAGAA